MSSIKSLSGWFIFIAFAIILVGCASDKNNTEAQFESSGAGGGVVTGGTIETGASGDTVQPSVSGASGTSSSSPGECGNGTIESGEQCEPGVAVVTTCLSLRKGSGTVGCDATCHFDVTGCTGSSTSAGSNASAGSSPSGPSAGSSPSGPSAGSGGSGPGAGSGGNIGNTGSFTVNYELSSAIQTVGIVTWSTSVNPVTEAYIEFGLDTNYGMKAPVDLTAPDYRTLLIGMKGSREYHFRIVATDGTSEYHSEDYTITTGPVTNLVQVLEKNVDNEAASAGGFVITSLFQAGPGGVGFPGGGLSAGALAFITDPDGDIVWWYSSNLTNITAARLSYDGSNMWMVTSGQGFAGAGLGIERVSMDGLDSQTYPGPATHDITPVTGNVMAFLQGGFETCAALTEITPDGTTKVVYDTSQIFGAGPCHGNAIRYSETEGVYTLSDLRQGDILWIDRQTGALLQRLSEFSFNWGRTQHGHHLLDNSIVIFNNGARIAQEISLNSATMQSAEIWRYSSSYSSEVLGDVQRLPNGNTLVTYSTAGRIHEVDPNGVRVMELRFSATIGYVDWRQSLYDPPPAVTM